MSDDGITYTSDHTDISSIETPGLPTLTRQMLRDAKEFIRISPYEFISYTVEERALYLNALIGHKCEYANGPLGGWADAYRNLVKLGWKEVIRECGCREYVTMVKPLTVYDIIDMGIYTDEGKVMMIKLFESMKSLFGNSELRQIDDLLESIDRSLHPTLRIIDAIRDRMVQDQEQV